MAKKSKFHNGKKESHSKQDHADKHGRGNDPENAGNYRQMDPGNGMAGGGNQKEKGWMTEDGQIKGKGWMAEDGNPKGKEWIPEVNNPNQQPWIPEISTSPTSLFSRLKNACLPKALMLLLPFVALGVYLVIAL
jgi:hypothetical protein